MHAFSHWTWAATGHRLVVVDVQGVRDESTGRYMLTDPAIHCAIDPLRFTGTNLGKRGIDAFFMTHKCGPQSAALRLPKHPMQVDEQAMRAKAKTAE